MRRTASLLSALCLALLLPASVLAAGPSGPARTTATWTRAADGPQLFWGSVGFAASTCQLVHFGGTTGYAESADTWLFDPARNTWATVARGRTWPAIRTSGGMTWDPSRARLILFGGRGGRTGAYQDTWTFDPVRKSWAPLITNCRKGVCPPARWSAGMVWSSVLGRVLLFGGMAGDTVTMLDDLWAFGTGWTELHPTGPGPSARYMFGMAEDARTGLIVVYGGGSLPAVTPVNDTWLFDPRTTTWTKVVTPTQPPAFAEVAMGWSASIGAVVMTGGSAGECAAIDDPGTWAFDMGRRDWVRLSTTGGPPSPRNDATLTANACDGSVILFGGVNVTLPPPFSDWTWILR